METVGRTWYLKITEGMINHVVELGTYHVASGTQVWQRFDWAMTEGPLSEEQILDELWAAALAAQERRTHIG